MNNKYFLDIDLFYITFSIEIQNRKEVSFIDTWSMNVLYKKGKGSIYV